MAGFGHHFLFSGQADLVSTGIFRPVHGAVRPADDFLGPAAVIRIGGQAGTESERQGQDVADLMRLISIYRYISNNNILTYFLNV